VITWKAVQHPNVLPLLGVAIAGDRTVMVSEWMAGGNIKEFIETHPNANRYKLVGFPLNLVTSSAAVDHFFALIVGKCHEGFGLYPFSGNDT
jgi:serine/threonine protein kinase